MGFDTKEHDTYGDVKELFLHNYKGSHHNSPMDGGKDQETSNPSDFCLDDSVLFSALDVHMQKLNKHQKRVSKRERKAIIKMVRGIEHAALVVKTRTNVDVLWQDGTKSCGVEACSLLPIEYLSVHEFWPEQYVFDEKLDGEEKEQFEHRIGKHVISFSLLYHNICRDFFMMLYQVLDLYIHLKHVMSSSAKHLLNYCKIIILSH